MAKPKRRIDIYVEDHGTLALFKPKTSRAKLWFDEEVNCPPELRFGSTAAAVERRFVSPIIQGARAAGLHVVMK